MKNKYYSGIFRIIGFCAMIAILATGTQNSVFAQQQKKSVENMSITTNQDKTLTVYPVPVSTTVHIHISSALRPDVAKLQIYNLIGRKVAEQSIIDPTTTDVSFSNLNQYPSGVYLVIARDKYGRIVKSAKMIIDK